jgi:hypothetical protein
MRHLQWFERSKNSSIIVLTVILYPRHIQVALEIFPLIIFGLRLPAENRKDVSFGNSWTGKDLAVSAD